MIVWHGPSHPLTEISRIHIFRKTTKALLVELSTFRWRGTQTRLCLRSDSSLGSRQPADPVSAMPAWNFCLSIRAKKNHVKPALCHIPLCWEVSGKYLLHQSSGFRILFFRAHRNTDEAVPWSKVSSGEKQTDTGPRVSEVYGEYFKQALCHITLCGELGLVLQRVSLTEFLPNQPKLCKTNSLSSGVDEVRSDCAYMLSVV